jgi:hypothetical protein
MSELFNAPAPTTQEPDQEVDYFANLVGEGKKFKTPQDLARGKAEADAFIARLQQEQADLRNELAQRARLAELVDRLDKPQDTPPPQQQRQDTPTQPENQGIDPSKLNEIVNKLLSEREAGNTAKQNLDAVKQTLVDKLGPNYAEKIKTQATQLGVSTDFMESVAKQSPSAFYNLIGLNATKTRDGFVTPDGQRTSFEPTTKGRDMKHYENIRKTDPTKYWSPQVQNQLHKDALAMGEKFFN